MCLKRHASKLCTLREKERCSQLLPQESRPPYPISKGARHFVRTFFSWLRLPTELTLWPCRLPLAEAKRLKSTLRKVASVGLCDFISPPIAEERVTVHTRVFQFLRKLFLTSQVVQQLSLIL